jgi:hypothetical protein
MNVEKPPLPDIRTSNRLFASAVTVWAGSALLTTVIRSPAFTDGGTVYDMPEITICGPAG